MAWSVTAGPGNECVILKYTAYIISAFVVLVITGLLVKPVGVSSIDLGDHRDPFLMLREAYAKAVWQEFSKQTETEKKFMVIQRVLGYSPSFRPAYEELCNNAGVYRVPDVSIRDFLRFLKQGADTFEELRFTECYIFVLTDMHRHLEALSFLSQRFMHESEEDKQERVMGIIKFVQHEKNTLDLAKAVEKYYQGTKSYPGDILVLVREGFMDRIPDEPYGGQYFISSQGQIKSTSEIRNE